jgi:hypothetical protein
MYICSGFQKRERIPISSVTPLINLELPLLGHQDSLSYLGVDDELLLAVAQVEGILEESIQQRDWETS